MEIRERTRPTEKQVSILFDPIVICIIGHTAQNSQIAKGYRLHMPVSKTHSMACFSSHYASK